VRIASVIITSAGGARLGARLIAEMPGNVRSSHAIALDDAGCAAVLVEHACDYRAFEEMVRTWAARRGWLATLAPLHYAE